VLVRVGIDIVKVRAQAATRCRKQLIVAVVAGGVSIGAAAAVRRVFAMRVLVITADVLLALFAV
jgi:hypothetical protein